MPQPQRVTISETETVSGDRLGPSHRRYQLVERESLGC